MPIGVIINSSVVLCGGLIGAAAGDRIPQRLRKALPLVFGVASMAMGIGPIVGMNSLPAVILALILGSVIGELIGLERLIEKGVGKIKAPLEKLTSKKKGEKLELTQKQDDFMEKFVSVVVLFCASGTGIFGALTEGMTGDYTILLSKSILDFFSSMIFAASLGYLVAAVAIPQFIIMIILFFSAIFIMPLTTPTMLADFTALGGIIMVATGLRISEIKSFPIANMLPGFILVMPLSYLWTLLMG